MPLVHASQLKKFPTREEIIDWINFQIVQANEQGRKAIRVYGPDGEFGKYGCENDLIVKDILEELKNHGYDARISYEFRQFSDTFLEVKW